jgi:nucleolar protein 14
MAKRKAKAKRSLASLPKGLPTKSSDTNPFEVTKRQRRPKHDVVNRFSTSSQKPKPSKLAESLQRRQAQLRASLKSSRKVNSFVDRRIGEYTMSPEEQVLARLVKERSLRSKRTSKYSLEDDDEQLTHKGKSIDKMNHLDHVILSSDEEDGGDLDAVDTELHFGGGSERSSNPYGPASDGAADMAKLYSQRKTDLDDLIKRRKLMKAEKMQSKEKQLEIFESMEEGFKQLSELLQFRDKEKERKIQLEKKQAGTWSEEDKEMADWDKEMKTYLFERKVKATDRTKTPEEIAKEEAERLHELETRRLARMNGDFEDDDLSDISDEDEAKSKKRRVSKKRKASVGPESLEDYDSEKNEDQLKVKFTADGLVYVDKEGNLIKKVGDDSDDNQGEESSESEEEANSDEDDEPKIELDAKRSLTLTVGTRVFGNYRAKKQFDEQEAWYEGTITQVHVDKAGNTTYDVEYDDGDFEENMEPENVRAVKRSTKEREKEAIDKESALSAKRKRQKAKQKAR